MDTSMSPVEPLPTSTRWLSLERLGMGLSLGCAVHCLLSPVFVAILPVTAAAGLLGHDAEAFLLAGSASVTALALAFGFRRHRQLRVLLLFGIALVLLAAGYLYADHPYEAVLVNAGLAFLIPANLLNRRLCKHCKDCHPSPEKASC